MRNVPELPPGYSYDRSFSRVYITFPGNGYRRHMCYPNTNKRQYWLKDESAAIAAWKHAYTELKEAQNHAQSIG